MRPQVALNSHSTHFGLQFIKGSQHFIACLKIFSHAPLALVFSFQDHSVFRKGNLLKKAIQLSHLAQFAAPDAGIGAGMMTDHFQAAVPVLQDHHFGVRDDEWISRVRVKSPFAGKGKAVPMMQLEAFIHFEPQRFQLRCRSGDVSGKGAEQIGIDTVRNHNRQSDALQDGCNDLSFAMHRSENSFFVTEGIVQGDILKCMIHHAAM